MAISVFKVSSTDLIEGHRTITIIAAIIIMTTIIVIPHLISHGVEALSISSASGG